MYFKKILSLVGISAIACLAGGWWGGYENIKCKDLRQEIVDLTVDQQASVGYALIKIYDPTQVSRTKTRVLCKGLGAFTDGDEIPIKYEVYKDREGDWMLQYEAL